MSIASVKNATPETWLPSGEKPQWEALPNWLALRQNSAALQYEETGLPGLRDEEWRYTNLRALKSADLAFPSKPLAAVSIAPSDLPRLVFVNGHYSASLSSLNDLANDVIVTDLKSALVDHSDQLESVFGKALPAETEQHGFTLLNSAHALDGYVVLLPKNTALDTAIEVVFMHDGKQAIVTHSRNLVVAAAHSQCAIVERHIGGIPHSDTPYLNNSITEIHAGDGAKVDHYKLQQESIKAFHVGGVYIKQARSSEVKTHSFALNGELLRNDVLVNLEGEGAHVEMNGLVLGQGQAHIDNHTQVNHLVPHCTSDEYYKTILDDKSRSVFRGRIIVAQDAQLTNADQQNNNLLLSQFAEADTKPQLEIYADDVKCSHGATVGQLDEKSLFYLQSRGIDRASAKALLTFAFANEVVQRINLDPIRKELSALLAGELVAEIGDLL